MKKLVLVLMVLGFLAVVSVGLASAKYITYQEQAATTEDRWYSNHKIGYDKYPSDKNALIKVRATRYRQHYYDYDDYDDDYKKKRYVEHRRESKFFIFAISKDWRDRMRHRFRNTIYWNW